MFNTWSTEALRGYVVMLDQFLSVPMSEEATKRYSDRLTTAKQELDARERASIKVEFIEELEGPPEPA